MARTADARTRNEALYLDIRAQLLRGDLSPGQRIRTEDLCVAFGVSVSVVREVLTRFTAQRLVMSEPNKGFRVTPITVEAINDLCLLRSELEGLAVRLAVERGDVDWEASVIAAHHRLANAPRPSIAADPQANERWSILHSEFHAVCASGCGSPRLCAIRQDLFDEAEIFRQYARLYGGERATTQEHAAITGAIMRRDAALAEELVRAHVERTARATLDAWNRPNRENAPANS
ncbi:MULTISPECIES: GntR family transcriptional regulator [unclassified Pseudofrankia]|uniref:GntR family transcriptional regulator n=1 Tax=unclassified Pseudofrankia TaxID=2994372 RepID=UPI0008D8EAB8|nr:MULTISPECIES: FCD domain-containing protein [unclassified Pseudofrankia]MDT3446321.1 FCD domain-containing protein [Pseudofrankia sp. BMG5.37]OHV57230.1 hypothetical protein BCD48_43180 [Pseudofrankia sp. BMG5.36]